MEKPISFTLFIFLIGSMLPISSLSERGIKFAERRAALVIGNGHCRSAPLKNPSSDAQDMVAVLKKLGFKVILKVDASHKDMENSIRQFEKQ